MDTYEKLRRRMVEGQIEARGVRNDRVLDAMLKVPRHIFVPDYLRDMAYEDCALELSHGQTISQPYIVALMTELLSPGKGDKVLEIGTGSGYQAAVLAELAGEVYTLEVIPELHASAKKRLEALGYGNVRCILGDGYMGHPDAAPYDLIIATASPPDVPMELVRQLANGGRLVMPVGSIYQVLVVITKDEEGNLSAQRSIGVRFVPMVKSNEKET